MGVLGRIFGRFASRVMGVYGDVREFLRAVFEVVDESVSDLSRILDEHGPIVLDFTYKTAVKLERAIPDSGFGSVKLALFDGLLREKLIPVLEGYLGRDLSDGVRSAVREYALKELAKFIADRNKEGDWRQYFEDLERLEKELFDGQAG